MQAPVTDFITIENNPPPPGAEISFMDAPDGARLRTAFFPVDNPRGTVTLAPGWSEFIEKYFEVVGDLHARSLNVAIMDWRGQGLSDWPGRWKGYVDQITGDLSAFQETQVVERFKGPYLLLTHSMGGLPGLKLLGPGYDGFARAVLCAPLTRLFPSMLNSLAGITAAALCRIGFSDMAVSRQEDDSRLFDDNMFTTCPVRHARFRALQDAEPRAMRMAPTYGWVDSVIRASREIHAPGHFDAMTTPTLIVSAGDERRIDGEDHADIATRSPLIEQVEIDGALHEVMMERDDLRANFWDAVDPFMAPALGAVST